MTVTETPRVTRSLTVATPTIPDWTAELSWQVRIISKWKELHSSRSQTKQRFRPNALWLRLGIATFTPTEKVHHRHPRLYRRSSYSIRGNYFWPLTGQNPRGICPYRLPKHNRQPLKGARVQILISSPRSWNDTQILMRT
jgi:hypothetical protein